MREGGHLESFHNIYLFSDKMKLFVALASLSVALVVAEDGACYTHVNVR